MNWNSQNWKAGYFGNRIEKQDSIDNIKKESEKLSGNLDIRTKRIEIRSKQQCKIHNVFHLSEDHQAHRGAGNTAYNEENNQLIKTFLELTFVIISKILDIIQLKNKLHFKIEKIIGKQNLRNNIT